MKEDVLEQIVDDYLQHLGYFTMHNVRFRPDPTCEGYDPRADAVHSDIDVVGIHPNLKGVRRVMAVSCKSWQSGFSSELWLAKLRDGGTVGKRYAWQALREIGNDKWASAFRSQIHYLTGSTTFTYSIAVTKLVKGDAEPWNADPDIHRRLAGNPFEFLTVASMWHEILSNTTATQASSEIGRLAQVLKAAGVAK